MALRTIEPGQVMICLSCDNEEFRLHQNAVIEQEFKDDVFQVETPAFACTKCGRLTLDIDTADELRRRTADAYRSKHGLFTSNALRALREVMGMNQIAFAKFLGVGEASVKRWETWLVQDKSSNELIRLKCSLYLGYEPELVAENPNLTH
jgi:putative zinc finger/helix-turn-helix YgiT family protein